MSDHPASDAAQPHESGDVPAGDDGMAEIEVGPLTYDRLRAIARTLNCTVDAALEEVLREYVR